MPVIGIPLAELTSRLGREIGRSDLLRLLERTGCDVEGYEVVQRVRCAACGLVMELVGKEEAPPRCDACDADLRTSREALVEMPGLEVVRMELLAVRPDLFDPGGLGRSLRGILGQETGLPAYTVHPASLCVRIDDSVRRAHSSRPYIACAVLEDVHLDHDRIKILMKMQENLHWALGRDRKQASIGVYDLDSLGLDGSGANNGGLDNLRSRERGLDSRGSGSVGPTGHADLDYTTEDPHTYDFVPLGAAGLGPEHRRSLRRILEEHPKGMAYAHLLAGFDRYPILRTRAGRVLSMPPIINSEETKVHLGSRRLFIDVTGTGRRVVQRTLNILVTSMLELDPATKVYAVRLENATIDGAAATAGPARETGLGSTEAKSPRAAGGVPFELTPDLTPQRSWIDCDAASRLLGIPFDVPQLRELLLRMRHGLGGQEGRRVEVLVPAYRNDILHQRDLMEDVAIAYGYDHIEKTLVQTQTLGLEDELERGSEEAREVMVGLGFVEILSLVLTCHEQSDHLLGRSPHPNTVLLENPISLEQTQLRTSLIPGLLTTLARNRHNSLPQEIFEVGDVTYLDAQAETGAAERRHLAFGLISPRAGFADIRALVEAVVREYGWELTLEAHRSSFLLDGRGARILAPDHTVAGIMGEIHPEVLERLGLQNPVAIAELALPGVTGAQEYLSMP